MTKKVYTVNAEGAKTWVGNGNVEERTAKYTGQDGIVKIIVETTEMQGHKLVVTNTETVWEAPTVEVHAEILETANAENPTLEFVEIGHAWTIRRFKGARGFGGHKGFVKAVYKPTKVSFPKHSREWNKSNIHEIDAQKMPEAVKAEIRRMVEAI